MIQLQPKKLVQPTNATHHSIKIRGELVGTKAIKSKGAYNERVNRKPKPTLKDSH